jgi:uncharacterized protein (TIGR02246 family)
MNAFRMAALAVAGLFALTACAPPAADTKADEAAIRTAADAWTASYKAGDADQIVALYAEDAVLMPPDATARTGPAAIREFLAADSAASKAAGVALLTDQDVIGVSANLGWHSGTFKVADAAGTIKGTGKFVEVWRKADGRWLLIRDIWNNDPPSPAPAAQP